jgi:hypothetical protein
MRNQHMHSWLNIFLNLDDETFKCYSMKTLLDLFLNIKILVVHLTNYIDLNNLLHHVNNFSCSNND